MARRHFRGLGWAGVNKLLGRSGAVTVWMLVGVVRSYSAVGSLQLSLYTTPALATLPDYQLCSGAQLRFHHGIVSTSLTI